MSVKLAKTAGFCMGVRRAVDMVLDMVRRRDHGTIYTYGPLIHNPQTVDLLRQRGIVPIRSLREVEGAAAGASMVIRAHGISPVERKEIRARGFRIIDATCPKVAHVQAIIRKRAKDGFAILIAGDREHPEVNGLLGFAGDAGIVVGSPDEVDRLPALAEVCVVAQTTQSLEEYAEIVERVRRRFPDAVIFDTICDSTEKRQTEIKALADETDAVFVVGGRNSANTCRLTELAGLRGKPAFHIETAAELRGIDVSGYRRIGVSAGASTPNWIIGRVVDQLTGNLGRREEFLRYLFKIWVFAVRTDIHSAIGAGFLSLAATLLQGLPLAPPLIPAASLYVFAMHVINRTINRQSSSISSFREESYLLHRKRYVTLAGLSLLAALGLALLAGVMPFLLLSLLSLAGVLYNTRILPRGWRFQSVKDIPGSKNIFTAIAWAAAAVLLPWVAAGPAPTPGVAVAFLFISGLVFTGSVLSDLLDIQSDRLIGRETLPVLIGEKKTLTILKGIPVFLFVMLVAAPIAGWSTSLGFFLLSAVISVWICLKLYDRRTGLSGVVMEGLLESGYVIAGLSSLLWLLAVRGLAG